MAVDQLSERPELQIRQLIEDNWDATNVRGYDPTAALGDAAYVPLADSIDSVGAVYPSIVIPDHTESGGTGTGYTHYGTGGPGRSPTGSVTCVVRAEDSEDEDYVGDSANYSATDASEIAFELLQEVQRIIRANPKGGTTDFLFLGVTGQTEADDRAPDDGDPTRIEQCTIAYQYIQNAA